MVDKLPLPIKAPGTPLNWTLKSSEVAVSIDMVSQILLGGEAPGAEKALKRLDL